MAVKSKSKKSSIMMEVFGIVGGAIAARIVTTQGNKLATSMNLPPVIAEILPVGLGIVLAMNKNKTMQGVGYGMIAVGGANLAQAFIPGMNGIEDASEDLFLGENYIGEDQDGNPIFLSDPADQSILSEPADQSILSGMSSEELEEMVINGGESDDYNY